MEKNYYEILQVDKNASSDIIEKAYKTLAKKYHPDLQEEAYKKQSEEILKKINEAYETLSNSQKREQYNKLLEQQHFNNTISKENYNDILRENQILKNKLKNRPTSSYNAHSNINNSNKNYNYNHQNNIYKDNLKKQQEQLRYEQELQNARQRAYHDAYIQDLKNRGYKIKYSKLPKDYFKNFISLILTIITIIAIFAVLWILPFSHDFLYNLYNDNAILKVLIDGILGTFNN